MNLLLANSTIVALEYFVLNEYLVLSTLPVRLEHVTLL